MHLRLSRDDDLNGESNSITNQKIPRRLYEHLAEIDTSACNMAEYLIKNFLRYMYNVLRLAIQYAIINNGKDGAYYGNKKCKCNSSCAA